MTRLLVRLLPLTTWCPWRGKSQAIFPPPQKSPFTGFTIETFVSDAAKMSHFCRRAVPPAGPFPAIPTGQVLPQPEPDLIRPPFRTGPPAAAPLRRALALALLAL